MFTVTIKQNYSTIKFTFNGWNEACDFAGDAVMCGPRDIEVMLGKANEEESDG